ncbi:unnamed protein product, partial [Rotaria sp. Silwood2]
MGNRKSRPKRTQPLGKVSRLQSTPLSTQVKSTSTLKSSRNFDRCPEKPNEFAHNLTTPSPTRTLSESVILVWLDSRIDDAVADTRLTKHMLGTLIANGSLHSFTNTTDCLEFITQRQDTIETIFLIMSGE